ncbi:MAG: hypothetical protein A3F11_03525 [Gammaproteobacteria bacterium RIFCSPHIGHO2_12_FULL_37_14]|nr:MAG: hypothetical protein A3F11_03525 [Gammaproteobacteria bacterium RIFCSPHIGHO2_12_FULL_37_14]
MFSKQPPAYNNPFEPEIDQHAEDNAQQVQPLLAKSRAQRFVGLRRMQSYSQLQESRPMQTSNHSLHRVMKISPLHVKADQGDSASQRQLGLLYFNGSDSMAQDYAEAHYWLSLAAQQKDAEAQYHLGLIYHYGHNVEVDEKRAILWYQQAAHQFPMAQQQIQCIADRTTSVTIQFLAALALKDDRAITELFTKMEYLAQFVESLMTCPWVSAEQRHKYLTKLNAQSSNPAYINAQVKTANEKYAAILYTTQSKEQAFRAALPSYRSVLPHLPFHDDGVEWQTYVARHAAALHEQKLRAMRTNAGFSYRLRLYNKAKWEKYCGDQSTPQAVAAKNASATSSQRMLKR